MKEERILDALGSVKDKYILEAAPTSNSAKPRSLHWIAAVLIFLAGMTLFAQTSPGAAAAAFVKEQVASLVETLFPPKEITVTPEGTPESGTYTAGGQDSQQDSSGYIIYYDPAHYEMTEECGATYIRSIPIIPSREEIRKNHSSLLEGLSAKDAESKIAELLAQQESFYASLPKCELEILHIPNAAPEDAAAASKLEKQQNWTSVSEIDSYIPLGCITFQVSSGTTWDSPVEQLYFVQDGQNGTYRITVRYFLEAAEGHGARLNAILNTFEVIPPQPTNKDSLVDGSTAPTA